MKQIARFVSQAASCFVACMPLAMAADPVSSAGNDIGDHLRLTTDAFGFAPASAYPGVASGKRCVGAKTTFSRVKTGPTDTTVRFHTVVAPTSKDTCAALAADGTLTTGEIAAKGSLYTMPNDEYEMLDTKVTGLAFGALVVPFKFRLGGDKKLVSSATIAPFLGARWSGFQTFGFEFMPVVSAGLGLVPVTDPNSKTTETRAAFSTAVGVTLNSKKSADFSAGIVFGKDYLNKADRLTDPSVNKAWVSIWLGVAK